MKSVLAFTYAQAAVSESQTAAETASPYASYGWYALAAVVAVLAVIGLWIWMKGRRLPGEHVFRESRFSRGNHLFPSQVIVSPQSLTLYKPSWIGKTEESIHMAHIASVKIDTHLLFSDIFVETSGGHNPVVCYGHTKGDAIEIKGLLEKFQSEYYKGKSTS
jgi:hypothetical protein